jgi:CheY-like chemotaxis protein
VLIVDDDPWILRMVSTLLEKRGYEIVTAGDGEEALAKAERTAPDLIITDVMMPKVDGWTLVRTLRSRPGLALVPVIFLTALGGEEDRIRGFRLGADDYLPKPFRFEELDLRVQNALRKSQVTRASADQVRNAPPPVPRAAMKKAAGIAGTLDQLGLSSLLIMLEMERKTGVLKLDRGGGGAGRIYVRQGHVVSAKLDGEMVRKEVQNAADAVYTMLRWAEGRFEFSGVEVDMEDEVQLTTTHLLMEGARLIDEDKR